MNNRQICIASNVSINDNHHLAFLSIANAFGDLLVRDTRMPCRARKADCLIYRVEEDTLNTDEHAHSATNQHFARSMLIRSTTARKSTFIST
ncbi:unnamed protein product [Adineta ricciae]|uniref:Uncharacterized protein n=1 Tax=Adineta ricciae TaxID=249248 RepID=A0A814F3A4_ADIRI|nr:unnamed protein product [Adineta ricciae]CAF0977520.1 unnamed protein product [Adineta ricciae]